MGRPISFDHAGVRLVGLVEAQHFSGYTQRGHIPDYQLTVRGKTGAALTISLVESYASFPEPP